jgi:Flp pilus assembly protein CpaB
MAAGQRVTDGMIEVKALPESALVKGAATVKAEVVGHTLRYPVARGEQLTSLRLVEARPSQALSFQIPRGMRGFTIPIAMTKSPAALIAPGDFVDVLATVETPILNLAGLSTDASVRAMQVTGAVTLLQNVQVLSVQRNYLDNGVPYDDSVRGSLPKDNNITFLTLSVNPTQAQALSLAVHDSKLLTVSLRPFGDDEIKDLTPTYDPLSTGTGR